MSLDIRHQIMKVPAFRGCDEPFVARVAENTKVFEASPGTAVVSHGEFTKDVYINFDGLLDITYLLEDGKKVTFDLITPHRLFGEISSLDGRCRSATISCFTKAIVGKIDNRFFSEKMLTHTPFLMGLLRRLSVTVRKNNQQIVHLASADSRKRVIIQLLRLSRPIAENSQILEVIQGFSHDALASFVGLSRETVTRMITLLKRDGLIFQTQKGVICIDVDKISNEISLSGDELITWT